MSIEIRTTDDDQWNDIVDDSPQTTPFHRAEALDVIAEHSGADLYRLVGYKGQEPVGVFPVFSISKGPISGAFSPPPNLKVHYLGPALLNFEKLKRRKRDKRNQRFVDGVIEWVDEEVSPRYWNLRTPIGYGDARPFTWNEFDASPRYTYVVDLTRDEDELLSRFSSDARRNITGEYDVDFEVTEGGLDAIDSIIARTRERHEEQGESYPVTAEFVRDLHDRLPTGTIRPYVCRVEGEFAGGAIDLESDGRAGAWIGGAKADAPVPVNDLLEWRIATDARDRGCSAFDLVGANHERIYSYKAKFAPDLVPYFSIERGSTAMTFAAQMYKNLR
ncbi:GNAT family N-acetyltransferase (plasmid) [Halorarum halophilum]|uniref:GNAT family N-acetyltransferase n=1 Tax=Halorarum halophilum TaxID=2743090 RepID=A0A7D5GE86_9EURY|nr:GNAT family N-acetyltransferase [Halobaculum halophilum]QLG29592.1 GNAT family N-acetyltransferase [Halobaculum halophilum]